MNFDKESKSDFFFWGGGGGQVNFDKESKSDFFGGGGGRGAGEGSGPSLLLQIFIKIFWHNHIIIF